MKIPVVGHDVQPCDEVAGQQVATGVALDVVVATVGAEVDQRLVGRQEVQHLLDVDARQEELDQLQQLLGRQDQKLFQQRHESREIMGEADQAVAQDDVVDAEELRPQRQVVMMAVTVLAGGLGVISNELAEGAAVVVAAEQMVVAAQQEATLDLLEAVEDLRDAQELVQELGRNQPATLARAQAGDQALAQVAQALVEARREAVADDEVVATLAPHLVVAEAAEHDVVATLGLVR